MKKIICSILILISSVANAKVVHFVVDMSQQTVNATGVHIVGDFQTIAGYSGGDWNSATTLMTQMVSDTNMYEVYVDIPAFAKYEYKFVNGDQFYEAEFVPIESRIGYNFNDNRWIYVDSIANDTSFVGALLFAGNAPVNKLLVRYLVDMSSVATVNSNGVHLIATYQSFNPTSNILYSFGANVYEVINYVDAVSYSYKYINGNSGPDVEIVPAMCSDLIGYRNLYTAADVVLPIDCFGGCGACTASGINENAHASFNIFPNPVAKLLSISFVNNNKRVVNIFNESGQVVYNEICEAKSLILDVSCFANAKYIVKCNDLINGIQESSLFIKNN